jgi:energy-coupling factor transporter transmembrane protein EcfT
VAGLKRLVLAYRPPATGSTAWPAEVRWRLLVYALLSLAAWVFPPWGALAAGLAALILGRRTPWPAWFLALGWFWLIVLAPVCGWGLAGLAGAPDPGGLPDALWRSLILLVLLMASQWLTSCTSIMEIQAALGFLFRPLGRRTAGRLSFLASLAIGFIPWTMDEIQAIREAGCLRAAGRFGALAGLSGLGLALLVRVFAKARHSAEAIELRSGPEGL